MTDDKPDKPAKPPHTLSQRIADYRKTFPRKVNERRLELIVKKHGPPDPERDGWQFDEHPGWREECERRNHANLTDEERAELAECTRIVNEWSERSPMWAERLESLADLEGIVERLKAKVAAKKGEVTK